MFDIQDYFEYIIKKHETMDDNPLIRIYVNKVGNIITLKIETLKVLESTNNKITKYKNVEDEPYLGITEVVLIHFNIANNEYQQNSREPCIHLFRINHLVNY